MKRYVMSDTQRGSKNVIVTLCLLCCQSVLLTMALDYINGYWVITAWSELWAICVGSGKTHVGWGEIWLVPMCKFVNVISASKTRKTSCFFHLFCYFSLLTFSCNKCINKWEWQRTKQSAAQLSSLEYCWLLLIRVIETVIDCLKREPTLISCWEGLLLF